MATDHRARIQDATGVEALVRPLSSISSVDQDTHWGGALETVMADTAAIDAFGRQRVSTPFELFDSKLLYPTKRFLFWDESLSGAASSTYASPIVTLAVAGAGDAVIRQTKQRFNYQSGKSQLLFLTGKWTREPGVAKRSGYWNGTDGIFFSMENSSAAWCIMQGGVITSAAQASWDDPMDGTGRSQTLLDFSGVELLYADFEWLGTGRVRVGFVLSGNPHVCHEFHNANTGKPTVYMNDPNLPLRHSLSSLGSAGTMVEICASVMSEGPVDPAGIVREIDTGFPLSSFTSSNVPYGILAIRLASACMNATIIPIDLSVGVIGATFTKWDLFFNPTVSGTLTWFSIPGACVEAAFGNPQIFFTSGTSSIEMEGSYFAGGAGATNVTAALHNLNTNIHIGANIDGTRDILGLAVTFLGAPASAFANMTWREVM